MWDFLSQAFNDILGYITGSWQAAITAVVNWVNRIVYAHYGYWHTVSGNVQNGWQVLTRNLLNMTQGLQRYMWAQSLWDFNISRNTIPWLSSWIQWLGGKQSQDLDNAVRMLERDIAAAESRQQSYSSSILGWVIIHILGYLAGFIDTALGWISGIGATMWHYFQNLEAFAELLFWWVIKSLQAHVWDVAEVLGEFLLALIVRNMVRFAKLLEMIISATL